MCEKVTDMPKADVRSIREEASAAGAVTLISFVYDTLRRNIIAGKYEPGEKLRIEPLRGGFGVAASTVREALARLTAEGLVTAEGQRGFRVAPMSYDDLMDITRLRVMLETEALADSIRHGDVAWECRVVAAFHNLSRAEERIASSRPDDFLHWEESNQDFHRQLTSACPSARLLGLVEILYRQHERYRMQSLMHRHDGRGDAVPTLPRNVHVEHEGLMNAAIARDADTARRLLTAHIETTASGLERQVFNRPPASGAAP